MKYGMCDRGECAACGRVLAECKADPCWFRRMDREVHDEPVVGRDEIDEDGSLVTYV